MKQSLNVVDYSTLIQNILLSISLIIGGFWAWYKFGRRKEVASLSVKIEKVEIIKGVNELSSIMTEVVVSNMGDRDVKLYYNFIPQKDTKSKFEELNKHYLAEINLYKVSDDEKLMPISKKVGLSSISNHYTGRLRTGVSYRLPYVFKVNEPGLYFIEFFIHINMKAYFKKDDYGDNPIKIFEDRLYYHISESDIKK